MKTKEEFEEKLKVGTKIRIGFKYSENHGFSEGEIIILVEGEFENDNVLYTNVEYAPSVWDDYMGEFESIYHLFGNDFDNWLDCTIVD
jgi:hypothetical protein